MVPVEDDAALLTCENARDGKFFLYRKSATITGYHDESLRWSGRVARRSDDGSNEDPGQRLGRPVTAK